MLRKLSTPLTYRYVNSGSIVCFTELCSNRSVNAFENVRSSTGARASTCTSTSARFTGVFSSTGVAFAGYGVNRLRL